MTYHYVVEILSSVPDVGDVISFDDGSFYLWIIVPLVKADVLRMVEDWQWSFDYDTVKSLFQ